MAEIKSWNRTILLGIGAFLGVLATAAAIHVSKKGFRFGYGLTIK